MPYTTSTSIHDVTRIELSKRQYLYDGKTGPYWVHYIRIHHAERGYFELNLFSATESDIPVVSSDQALSIHEKDPR